MKGYTLGGAPNCICWAYCCIFIEMSIWRVLIGILEQKCIGIRYTPLLQASHLRGASRFRWIPCSNWYKLHEVCCTDGPPLVIFCCLWIFWYFFFFLISEFFVFSGVEDLFYFLFFLFSGFSFVFVGRMTVQGLAFRNTAGCSLYQLEQGIHLNLLAPLKCEACRRGV